MVEALQADPPGWYKRHQIEPPAEVAEQARERQP
jgi:hypothetical protein